MKPFLIYICLFGLLISCTDSLEQEEKIPELEFLAPDLSLLVLGVAQDAGYPQTACSKVCCEELLRTGKKGALVSSVGLVDKKASKYYVFDASPDFPQQLAALQSYAKLPFDALGGLFLTHAHIGHYTGLMYLGRESVGAKDVPVYCMPKMSTFLSENGPWSQLVDLNNIALQSLSADSSYVFSPQLKVMPILVPHRGEFSETVGFKVFGPKKSALYIPDIDKWTIWDKSLVQELSDTDYALIDATFYANGEIPGRDMSEIPHPFVEETMSLLDSLDVEERKKVYFIHMNHTNPLLRKEEAYQDLIKKGYHVAKEGLVLDL